MCRTEAWPALGVDRIDLLHAGISAGDRLLLARVAEFDRSERWKHDGCRDMAQWLSGRLGISTWAARRWVAAAHALESLPLISHALETGTLCLDKVLELARFATSDSEAKLIAWATRVSAAAIRREGDREARLALDAVRDAERSRFLRWWWIDDGARLALEGEFPAADGATITTALRRLADRLPELPEDEFGEGCEPSIEDVVEARCADALVALASTTISHDADGDRATVVVHTAPASLGRRFGEIEGGPVIHPEVARRLSCDARLQFVLTDRDGNALGIGRASRTPPRWLLRALRFRDGGCTFPGRDAKLFLRAHHPLVQARRDAVLPGPGPVRSARDRRRWERCRSNRRHRLSPLLSSLPTDSSRRLPSLGDVTSWHGAYRVNA